MATQSEVKGRECADAALRAAAQGCSICGNAGDHETRYLAISAVTRYGKPNGRQYDAKDDLGIWRLKVCSECLPKARLSYIDNEISDSLKTSLAGALMLLMGAIAIVTFWYNPDLLAKEDAQGVVGTAILAPRNYLKMITVIAIAISLGLGSLLVVFGGVIAGINFIRRSMMSSSDIVSENWIDRCFEGECNRILLLINKFGASIAVKDLPIPRFKKIPDLFESERIQVLLCKETPSSTTVPLQWRKRQLLKPICKSLDEMIEKLPVDWKAWSGKT